MSKVTLKAAPINIAGDLPEPSSIAPAFKGVKTDLSELSLSDFKGQTVVLNIFPSIDTSVCAASVRKFNEEAGQLNNTTVLCVSADLPFAQGRFCGAEELENVIPVSVFRNREFGSSYGVEILDSALKGLMARAVVVIDKDGKVVYGELVPEITQEPDYEKALSAAGSV